MIAVPRHGGLFRVCSAWGLCKWLPLLVFRLFRVETSLCVRAHVKLLQADSNNCTSPKQRNSCGTSGTQVTSRAADAFRSGTDPEQDQERGGS